MKTSKNKKNKIVISDGCSGATAKAKKKTSSASTEFSRNAAMKEFIFVIENSDEGGYVAKALGTSIYTEGETLDELKKNIKDAIKCHFEKSEIPQIIRLHFVKDEVMAI
ncbi:MAG: type II toxin-antitoxin system HicB family antitoxin [Planctomycetaceae bacterium]|nr:type II toxin-antitoxin system HicB family antitoxin [Planctomycetaceae bacterium]